MSGSRRWEEVKNGRAKRDRGESYQREKANKK